MQLTIPLSLFQQFRGTQQLYARHVDVVVMHENEIIPNCTSKSSHYGMDNVVPISRGSHCTSIYDMQVRPPLDANTGPHHNRPTAVSVRLNNVTVRVSLPAVSPYSNTSITSRNMEATFICKQNCTPLPKLPCNMIACEHQADSPMPLCQYRPNDRPWALNPSSCNRFRVVWFNK